MEEPIDGQPAAKKRKRHTRTKSGCITCRTHKKKCDEQLPVCKRCRTNDRVCRYVGINDGVQTRTKTPDEIRDSPLTPAATTSTSTTAQDQQTAMLEGTAQEEINTSLILRSNTSARHIDPALLTFGGSRPSLVGVGSNELDLARSVDTRQDVGTGSALIVANSFSALPFDVGAESTLAGDIGDITSWSSLAQSSATYQPITSQGVDALPCFDDAIDWSAFDMTTEADKTAYLENMFTDADQILAEILLMYVLDPQGEGNDAVPCGTGTTTTGGRPGPESPSQPFLSPPVSGPFGHVKLPGLSDRDLMQYFVTVASRTSSAINANDNPFRAQYLPVALHHCSTIQGKALHRALFHSILCVSATHCYNLARKAGLIKGSEAQSHINDQQNACPDYALYSRNHRRQAFKLLTQTYSIELQQDGGSAVAASRCTTIMLLILAMVFEGNSRLIPSLLENARFDIPASPRTETSAFYIALHSIYSVLDNIGRQLPTPGSNLSWHIFETGDASWKQRGHLVVHMIAGVEQHVLALFARVHDTILEHQKAIASLVSIVPGSADYQRASWQVAELKAELDYLEGSPELFIEEETPAVGSDNGLTMRISIGSSLFRLAARVYILRVVFDVSKEDHRILYCVKKLVEMVTAVPQGNEVGLSWPLIIIGSEAVGDMRPIILRLIRQCQWKYSAPTLATETIVQSAWANGTNWADQLRKMGYPLII